MMLFPYQVDVPSHGNAVSNGLIVITTVMFSMAVLFGKIPEAVWDAMILKEMTLPDLIGSMFLHGSIMHLVGNMVFLWVFGNAVCAKLGNAMYLAAYLLLGIAAGATHLAGSDAWAIGASGAINGIVGMFIVLHPVSRISCWWFIYVAQGTFKVDARILIFFFFLLDFVGAMGTADGIGYFAHLGGFVAGFFLAVVLVWTGIVALSPDDRTLFDLVGANVGRRVEPDTSPPAPTAPAWPEFDDLSASASPAATAHPGPSDPASAPAPAIAPTDWTPSADCMQELTLGEPDTAAPSTPTPPPTAPPPTAPRPQSTAKPDDLHVVVQCDCGHRMRAPVRMVGRRAKCKKCGEKFFIPMPDDLDLSFE